MWSDLKWPRESIHLMTYQDPGFEHSEDELRLCSPVYEGNCPARIVQRRHWTCCNLLCLARPSWEYQTMGCCHCCISMRRSPTSMWSSHRRPLYSVRCQARAPTNSRISTTNIIGSSRVINNEKHLYDVWKFFHPGAQLVYPVHNSNTNTNKAQEFLGEVRNGGCGILLNENIL